MAYTAGPFLGGLAIGLLAVRAWRRPLALVPTGLGAWLGAAAVGMVIRVLAGQGTAAAFIVVALAFLGLFILGWRIVVRIVATRLNAVPLSRASPRSAHGFPLVHPGVASICAIRAGAPCRRPDRLLPPRVVPETGPRYR